MVARLLALYSIFVLSCAPLESHQVGENAFEQARERMVALQLKDRDIEDPRVLKAMGEVPRHEFIPEGMRHYSYSDSPVPIGLDQTISQPYIVALMTQLARPKATDRALEIGTGSGYQAAVLSKVVAEVYSIEIVDELARRASSTLKRLGYENVMARQGDGYAGWPEHGPFDLILITAAAPRIPEPLIEQLADGGRLVLPVGPPGGYQELILVEKKKGKVAKKTVIPVRFVPMTGQVQE